MKPTYEQLEAEVARLNKIFADLDVENPDAVNVMISAMKEQKGLIAELRAENRSLALQLVAVREALKKAAKHLEPVEGRYGGTTEIMVHLDLKEVLETHVHTLVAQMEKKMEYAIKIVKIAEKMMAELGPGRFIDGTGFEMQEALALWNTANEGGKG